MPDAQRIHRLIGKVGSDPKLINELLHEKDENARKGILVKHGLVGAGEKGINKQDMQSEIAKLLKGGSAPAGQGERLVEWVGAIATAAAGAAAAACTADA
jgi:hypothetical protein